MILTYKGNLGRKLYIYTFKFQTVILAYLHQ